MAASKSATEHSKQAPLGGMARYPVVACFSKSENFFLIRGCQSALFTKRGASARPWLCHKAHLLLNKVLPKCVFILEVVSDEMLLVDEDSLTFPMGAIRFSNAIADSSKKSA